jgi:ATP-dependent helicase HepA
VVKLLKIGMIVFPKGLIAPQLYRIGDTMGQHVDLNSMSLGAVPMQSPANDLRRYRVRTTDEVSWNDQMARVIRVINPLDKGLYRYEIEVEEQVRIVPEFELVVHEGSLSPDPAEMLAQLDVAPWDKVGARASLLKSYFNATARSMGIVGYNGARMLPIPHQINAARYALQFGRLRFLLADEVGLGKTVEAGLIVSTLRKYFPHWKTSIFVPESLTAQWAFEMYGKFGKMIFNLNEEEDEEDDPGVILPHHRAKAYAVRNKPEILVVDEAHRILSDERLMKAFVKMSRNAHAVLLLTATPVSDDSSNLLRLFQVLDPEQYGSIKKPEQMKELQKIEGKLEALLKAIRVPQPDHQEIDKAWQETGLDDKEIDKLLKNSGDDRTGRHALHRIATLITDRYYPGARMLRYRRKFLAQDNPLPFRIVDTIEYKVKKEEEVVVSLMWKWLGLVKDSSLVEDPDGLRLSTALIQATHSSPLALADWIAARKGELVRHEGVTADPILLAEKSMEDFEWMDGEDEVLAEMSKATERWNRFTRAVDATLRPLAQTGRFQGFLKFIEEAFEEDPNAHVLVFTSFEANTHPMYLLVKKAIGKNVEVFEMSGRQSRMERERSGFEFQDCTGGSLLISDELGGEGRNFQFASHVIHFDLPPAPWMVEQRIGRCDRVGRDEEMDVDSVVVVAKGQLDEALFDFLAEGVGVFNDSIAPVEGELDTIMTKALTACIKDGPSGMLDLMEETAEYLEEARERENSELLVRQSVGVEEARRIAVELNDEEELQKLRKHTIRYARLFDSMVDERKKNQVAITVGEFHSLHGTPGVSAEMIGFFNRKDAVRHERQNFFSPGHPFVRNLARMAMLDSPDRVAIVRRQGVEKPALLFHFRISIPPEFFGKVRSLDVELQPPLLSKSARLFYTRMVPLAISLDGEVLEKNEENAVYYHGFGKDDVSCHDNEQLFETLPKDWQDRVSGLAWDAQSKLEELLDEELQQKRAEFEDLVCEVLTRVNHDHELMESEVEEIMEPFGTLNLEIDSAVFFVS